MEQGGSSVSAGVLGMVAGYSDTVGYLSYGTFAGLMTGNTILLAIALARGDGAQTLHNAGIIAAFYGGVAAAALLKNAGLQLGWLLLIEAALLLAAGASAPPAAPFLLAASMGVQNAAATRFAGAPLNTVVLTGDVQKLIQGLAARLVPDRSAEGVAVAVPWLWLGYFAGALLGAAAHAALRRPLLLAPLLLPFVLLRGRVSRSAATAPR